MTKHVKVFMRSRAHTSAPWHRRPRSRSRSPRERPGHNPAHPSVGWHRNHPQPTAALTKGVKEDIEQLKQEAEWGDKMRPSDPDWLTDSHNRALQTRKQLRDQPPPMLLSRMPRNPATWHIEVGVSGSDAEKKD